MSEYGERLAKSFKQAAEIAAGTAKPGTYRITTYDDDGKPHVIADFSEEVLAEIDAEIAAEREAEVEARQSTVRLVARRIVLGGLLPQVKLGSNNLWTRL